MLLQLKCCDEDDDDDDDDIFTLSPPGTSPSITSASCSLGICRRRKQPSSPPPLYLHSSLWRHLQEQNECVLLKLTHWGNFTRLNSSEMKKFCLVPHVLSSGSSLITHMKWATPSGFYSWMFVTFTVRTNILIFLLQRKEKQWKRLQDFFHSSFLFSRYDDV